jgi:hypothetical protein
MQSKNKVNRKFSWSPLVHRLILVVMALNVIACGEKKKTSEENTADLVAVRENNSTVNAFINFVANDKNKMTLDHAYTNEALVKLTDALSAMADEINYSVKADIDKVKEYALNITQDPLETTHADDIRKSADIITTVFENIQQAKYPGLESDITALRSASASIKPDILTLDQRDAIKSFFSKAAEVLEKMN